MKYRTIIFGIYFITASSCEKKLFDYRNKYCGEYAFEVEKTLTVSGQGTETSNYEYNGSVSYNRDLEKDEILINYLETNTAQVSITKDGVFINKYGYNALLTGEFHGKENMYYLYSYSPAASGSTEIWGVRRISP